MIVEEKAYLEHFGVKGMQWGVRKDKKGPVSNLVNRRRTNLEAKYLQKGYSLSDAEKKAKGRLKAEAILAGVGGLAITAVAGYAAKEALGKRYASVMLKEGTQLKYINALGDKVDLDRRMYTTFKDSDTKKYKGLLAKSLQSNKANTKIYETVLTAKENIKAPSHNEAKKIFNEIKDNKEIKALGIKNYKQFNQSLVVEGPAAKAFFKELKDRGYNAVLDSNDQFMSGYNTKKPLILLNAASTTVKTGQKVVDQNVIDGLYKRQLAGVLSRQFVPVAGLGAAAAAGSVALDSSTKHETVNSYLIQNPRSTEHPAEVFSRLRRLPSGEYVVAGR